MTVEYLTYPPVCIGVQVHCTCCVSKSSNSGTIKSPKVTHYINLYYTAMIVLMHSSMMQIIK